VSRLGRPRLHLRVTGSTNDRARALATDGAPHGTLVTAREQTAGRGRWGRSWVGPPGRALLMSVVLRELDPLLPLRAGLAVADLAGDAARVKWPNDVWVEGRKVAGVLIEARPQDAWAVIGVGLNVAVEPAEFPPELRETATSIGGGATVPAALAALNRRLGGWTGAAADDVLAAFRERDALRGREISWVEGAGVAEGIDERGNLLVRTSGEETVSLGAGEVHLRLC
jgi:BirA family biotin operon repressor/biotin-[acetyl-CoA-carboxylase] ligase